MTGQLSFDQLVDLAGHRFGKIDVPCPLCSHLYNPRKKVLRIWYEDEGFARYHCVRCEETGWAREGRSTGRPSPERLGAIRQEAAARDAKERAEGLRKSGRLWSRRQPSKGSLVEIYLQARGYDGPVPATLGFLPASEGYPPALIAAFGFADEPEPGILTIADEAVRGVQLTKLQPDGHDRLRDDSAKITVGRGSTGVPIVLAPPNDLLGLVIAEGVEDALSIHAATGLGAWAAGGAGRMPALATAVPDWIDTVTIAADDDDNGRRNAEKLFRDLQSRRINTELRILGNRRAAA